MLSFLHRHLCAVILLLTLQCCCLHNSSAFAPSPIKLQKRTHHHSSLHATTNNEKSTKSKSARERGIYSRPSAAIERGSGFFIPGLEGPRIRLLFGMTVLIADGANHLVAESQVGDYGQVVAEVLAAG